MLEPIPLTGRERELIMAYERQKVQARQAAEVAENQQKAIALCIIDRAGGDVNRAYALSEDGSAFVPVPQPEPDPPKE
jgi:hypothetical protein